VGAVVGQAGQLPRDFDARVDHITSGVRAAGFAVGP
jgi:hypothetical protein